MEHPGDYRVTDIIAQPLEREFFFSSKVETALREITWRA